MTSLRRGAGRTPINRRRATANVRSPTTMPTTFTHPDLPCAAVIDALERAGFDVGPARPVTRVVLDTFDGRLFAAGLRLEHHRDPEVALVLR